MKLPLVYRFSQGSIMDKNLLLKIFVITILLMEIQAVHASWWYLGMASTAYQSNLQPVPPSVQNNQGSLPAVAVAPPAATGPPPAPGTADYKSKCSELDVLAPHQRELCAKSRHILDVVADGAAMGINICQEQFRDRRWNCTTFNSTDVFGKVLQMQSREKAYIYSIQSAGVMHAVTKACAKGQLNICSCDLSVRNRDTDGKFMWGGCSHNVDYGDKFASEFVDSNENRISEEGMMNLWNNNAGRKAVKSRMQLVCKCHGVSGSCSVKICWRTMAQFSQVGALLKDRFDGASRVKLNRRKNRLRPIDKRQKRPTKKDLVYMQESPDYCEQNLAIGSLGTRGRQCNRTSYGLDGCTLMCCGRGYHIIVLDVQEDCNCKFFWCCEVKCDKCHKRIEQYFCN